jgi:ABC-2 type transport system permease protein
MNQWRIITLTIVKEWKTAESGLALILKFVTDAAKGAALAWIIYQSGNLDSLGYLTAGVCLLAIWSGGSAFGGWALERELSGRTLDHALISRTPMILVLFSQILAQILYEIPSGIIAGATVLVVVRSIPVVVNPAALIISLLLAVAGMTIVCTFLGAITVLAGAKAGAMIGIIPFGAVLSGLILPVWNLPLALEIPARMVPTSWTMDGVWRAMAGAGSWGPILEAWAVSIAVGGAWVMGTIYLCKVVERRIRIEGNLSSD